MPKYLTQQEAFLKCEKEGKFVPIEELDIDKVKSMLTIARVDQNSADILIKNIFEKSDNWSSVYKLYYDVLHQLAEAYLRLHNIKIDNHQCLFAYLTEKYPLLEMNWEILEKLRTKRNGINYYGTLVGFKDWKEVELPFHLYINKIREEILRLI